MIIIHVVLVARRLKDYSTNIQDLTNLYNKKVRYDRQAEN